MQLPKEGGSMIQLKAGDTLHVRSRLKNTVTVTRILAACPSIIITADKDFFIDRFDPDGWNFSGTREITDITTA